jgi:hypothetical protein
MAAGRQFAAIQNLLKFYKEQSRVISCSKDDRQENGNRNQHNEQEQR